MAGVDGQDVKLRAVLSRFKVSIAEPSDLHQLHAYEIFIIVDDSGSMLWPSSMAEQEELGIVSISQLQPEHRGREFQKIESLRRQGRGFKSRWDELQESLALIVDIGAVFDSSGIDIFFLNRGELSNVKSSSSEQFRKAFSTPPQGGTPLTQAVMNVASGSGSAGKPVLLFIFTDGEPDDGIQPFQRELTRLVKKKSTSREFRVQIMICTGDDDAVAWLDKFDRAYDEVDVTDDYFTELKQIVKEERTRKTFTRGDWCMKALLGPINSKFDAFDEACCQSPDSNTAGSKIESAPAPAGSCVDCGCSLS